MKKTCIFNIFLWNLKQTWVNFWGNFIFYWKQSLCEEFLFQKAPEKIALNNSTSQPCLPKIQVPHYLQYDKYIEEQFSLLSLKSKIQEGLQYIWLPKQQRNYLKAIQLVLICHYITSLIFPLQFWMLGLAEISNFCMNFNKFSISHHM